MSSGEMVGAFGVADQSVAKLVSTAGGQPTVTDGPYIETKEYIGSFTIVDVESEERALEIASRNPASEITKIEVRALLHGGTADELLP